MWPDGGPYETWSIFLRRWGAGERVDAADLPPLSIEDFTPDQWVRLSNHVSTALSRRLAAWAQGLTMAIQEARDEFGVARALTQARVGLRAIRAVAAHPGLPDDLTAKFVESVDTQVRSAQRMLETQVEDLRRSGVDRSRVEARLQTLRHNALTEVIRDAAGPAEASAGPVEASAGPVEASTGPTAVPDPWSGPTHPARRRVTPLSTKDKP
jgi:hypothetical protein